MSQHLRRLWLAGLLAVAAQPAAAQPIAPGEPLRIDSPPAVLADPVVGRCRLLAARRVDPELNPLTTRVETAAALLEVETLFDAIAACRTALRQYPAEPSVVVAHNNAAEVLNVIALGFNFPDGGREQLARGLEEAGRPDAASGLNAQIVGFFLGSAYEHGLGGSVDRAEAIRWYGVAARAGSAIARREQARIETVR